MSGNSKLSKRVLLLLGSAVIAALLAALLWWLSHLPFWVCLLLALGAMLVNGFIAGWEDGDFEPSSSTEHSSSLGRRPRG